MTDRFYLSNLRKQWPFSRQEALLDERAPGWRGGSVYRDDLPARKRKAHNVESLTERASMLRPTSRRENEVVTVASLSIMAWGVADFLAVLGALTGRGATLRAIAEDLTIAPDAGVSAASLASEAFLKATAKGSGEGPEKGGRISGAKREAAAKAKCEAVRHLWERPRSEYTDAQVAAEAGVVVATIKAHLGKRPKAIRERELREAQAQRNRARRKQP